MEVIIIGAALGIQQQTKCFFCTRLRLGVGYTLKDGLILRDGLIGGEVYTGGLTGVSLYSAYTQG